jgi:hypothetical protein
METTLLRNEFMFNLERITLKFVSDIVIKKSKIISNQNYTEFELKLLFLVRIGTILKNNFSDTEYNDILVFYHEKILKDKLDLLPNINFDEFTNERFTFHHNGIIEINNIKNIKNFICLPGDYTYVLENVLFENSLKTIKEIKENNFFLVDPLSGIIKHSSSLDLLILTNNYLEKVYNLSIKTDKNKWNLHYHHKSYTLLTLIIIILIIITFLFFK